MSTDCGQIAHFSASVGICQIDLEAVAMPQRPPRGRPIEADVEEIPRTFPPPGHDRPRNGPFGLAQPWDWLQPAPNDQALVHGRRTATAPTGPLPAEPTLVGLASYQGASVSSGAQTQQAPPMRGHPQPFWRDQPTGRQRADAAAIAGFYSRLANQHRVESEYLAAKRARDAYARQMAQQAHVTRMAAVQRAATDKRFAAEFDRVEAHFKEQAAFERAWTTHSRDGHAHAHPQLSEADELELRLELSIPADDVMRDAFDQPVRGAAQADMRASQRARWVLVRGQIGSSLQRAWMWQHERHKSDPSDPRSNWQPDMTDSQWPSIAKAYYAVSGQMLGPS